jgi:penicillin-binding protein 2
MYNAGRLRIIQLIFLAAIVILVARLFTLQVISGQYTAMANDESLLRKVVYPERGIIYDRKGRAIVTNSLVYDLMFTPSQLRGLDTQALCNVLGIDTAMFKKKITQVLNRKAISPRSATPVALFELLDNTLYARLQESIYKFDGNGIFLQERPIRSYPYGVGAHIFGYVAEVDTAYMRKSKIKYNQGDFAGKTGLEKAYEDILMGQRGIRIVQRDKHNREVGSYQKGRFDTMQVAGKALYTSIDIEVQQLAEKLLNNKIGSIVAIDPRDGGVIAMASGPNFNPNLLSGGTFKSTMKQLGNDPTHPLFNNAITMKSPPGSAFKPLGALIALDLGLITPSYGVGCGGGYYACGRRVACHGGGHGGNLRNAMAASCNSYFINIFRRVVDDSARGNKVQGYLTWKKYVNQFGIGRKLGIDIPGESGGYIPDTSRFNKYFGYGKWSSCTMSTIGIGQDAMEATPLQMANFMCLVANKGHYYTPHFVNKIENQTKEDTTLNKFTTKNTPVHLHDTMYEAVTRGMEDVVKSGTARRIYMKTIAIAGKTGTVENAVLINGKVKKQEEHSVFTCFAPVDSPKIAVCVYVRNSGQGAQFAAPMARLIIKKYLADTLDKKDTAEVNSWYKRTVIPPYIKELKEIQDSIIAYEMFKNTGDSSHILQYIPLPPPEINIDSLLKAKNAADIKLQEENKKKKAEEEKKKKQKEEEEKKKNKDGKEALPPDNKEEDKDRPKDKPKEPNEDNSKDKNKAK